MRIKKSIKTAVAAPEAPPAPSSTEARFHWAYLAGLSNRGSAGHGQGLKHWTGEELARQTDYQPGLPKDII